MLNPKDLHKDYTNNLKRNQEEKSSANQTLKKLQQEICNLQEDDKITRCAVNLLLDWAEDTSIQIAPLHQRNRR